MKLNINQSLSVISRRNKLNAGLSLNVGRKSFEHTHSNKGPIVQKLLDQAVMPEKEQRAYVKIIEQCRKNFESESLEVAQKAREIYEKAAHKLINGNARFIYGVAKEYANEQRPIGDLFAEGVKGAMHACSKIVSSECKPISYISLWVNQRIRLSVIQTGDFIRTPDALYAKIKKYTKLLNQGLSDDEIKAQTGWGEKTFAKITEQYKSKIQVLSLDEQFEEGSSLGNIVADSSLSHDKVFEQAQMKQKVLTALNKLEKTEQDVLKAFFAINREKESLPSLSMQIGQSPEQLKRTKRLALSKLEKELSKQGIKNDIFLGAEAGTESILS